MAKKKKNTGDIVPVVVYTRVSRMLENKASTQSQIAEAKKFCERYNYKIIKIYSDEDLSGSETTQRIAFNRMIDDITIQRYGKIDCVICYNISRFSRSVIDLNKYVKLLKEELDCDFRSIQEDNIDTSSPYGKFLLNIFGSVAELERDRLIDTISNSNINRAISGGRWTNGGIAPYGYVKEGRTIVPDPVTSEIVKRVFHLFVEEKVPLTAIAKRMIRDNVDPNRTDKDVSVYRRTQVVHELEKPISWNHSKIRRILDNPIYAGINSTCRRERTKSEKGKKTSHVNVDPSTWVFSKNLKINRLDEENFWNSDFEILGFDAEPLITWETFVKAQKIKQLNQKNPSIREKTNFLLKDFLYCGKCGRRMNGKVHHRDPKHTYYYYMCNKRAYLCDCDMENVRCEIVDNYVLAILFDYCILHLLVDYKNKEKEEEKKIIEKYTAEKNHIESELTGCETGIQNLLDMIMHADLDMSREILQDKLNKEVKRKARLESELEKLKVNIYKEEKSTFDINSYRDVIINKNIDKMSFEAKREIIEHFIEKVIYHSPDNIEIYIKINKTVEKIELPEQQRQKVLGKLEENKEKNKEKNKIKKFKNKVLKYLEKLDIEPFPWMWRFSYEPLRVHTEITTSTPDYIIIRVFFED